MLIANSPKRITTTRKPGKPAILGVRMTAAQKNDIRAVAAKRGISASELVLEWWRDYQKKPR